MNESVVIPLKRFDLAKERLRVDIALDVNSLAEYLAQRVILESYPRHVIVLSESPEISLFAASLGAEVWESDSTNLNEAVQHAYRDLETRFHRLIIVHGDLRYPKGLGNVIFDPGITIVSDHHGTGTNVLALPTGLDFRFSYGLGSLALHVREASRLNVDYRVITTSPWRFDVDEPGDLNDI